MTSMAPATSPDCAKGAGSSHASSTNSRQQRKREIDRRAQRMARERTKTRIADLEKLVDELQNQDTSGQVKALSESLQTMSRERDAAIALAKNLEGSIKEFFATRNILDSATSENAYEMPSLSKTVSRPDGNLKKGPTGKTIDSSCPVSPPGTSDNDTISYMQTSTIEDMNIFHDLSVLDLPADLMEDTTEVISRVLHDNSQETALPYAYPEDDAIYPASIAGCGCDTSKSPLEQPQKLNLWRFANEVLTRPNPLEHDATYGLDTTWQQDVPVRALVKGWSIVEREVGRLSPLWSKLRMIDETLFHGCGKVERLAILKTMHTLLLYHSEQTLERRATVPAWYLERPSQTISHSYAIDFFAWPGIRERFIFHQHQYCGNIFWQVFASSLRLLWPFEFRDTYTINIETGQYTISDAFEQRINDINAWTMTQDIFDRWPEFYSDIPAYPHLNKQISYKPPVRFQTLTQSAEHQDQDTQKALEGLDVIQ
ncbi:hypothetical protein B0T10DRAFT_590501 [Thelonectria olida]|uniref:BZIP transcription factor n=1 Tax=Thelonectria olida TaxID=1576542 RepID=A0A9P8VR36_9HYPO|nr:hypothetical protein B0T10DRAFT_590501 [Thelonectria olida]